MLIPGIMTIIAFLVVLFSIIYDSLKEGTFLILSTTLIIIVWYTYFTYLLVRKKNNPALSVNIKYISEADDIRVLVSNLCDQYLETEIIISFNINGAIVKLGPEYTGEKKWNLTPRFTINGHFPLDRPIKLAGNTYAGLRKIADSTDPTKLYQLSLQAKWRNEDGKKGEYPAHYWYYDFSRDEFVYQVGGFES